MSQSIGRAFWNSVLQTGNAFLASGLGFLVVVALTYLLGVEGFGSSVSSQAKVAVWILLVDLGLLGGAVSALTALRAGKGGGSSAPVLWRILLVRMLGAGLGLCLIVFFSYGTPTFTQDLSFAPYLFGYGIQYTLMSYFFHRQEQARCVAANLAGLTITSLGAIAVAYHSQSVAHVLLVQSMAPFLASLFLLAGLRSGSGSTASGQGTTDGLWRMLFQNSWPYAMLFVCTTLWQRLDQLTAANLFSLAEVGEYGLAVRLVGLPILMASAVSVALFPDFQRVGTDAPEKLQFYAGLLLKLFLRYGLPLASLTLLAMAFALSWVFPKFTVALHLIPWFIPGIWAYWMFNFASNALLGLRAHKEAVLAHLGGVALYVAALLTLPRFLGLPGIAIAYDLFCLTLFLLTYGALRRAKREGIPTPWSPFSPEERGALAQALRSALRIRNA